MGMKKKNYRMPSKKEQTEINDIKARAEKDFDMDIDTKESLYKEVDELEKEITKK